MTRNSTSDALNRRRLVAGLGFALAGAMAPLGAAFAQGDAWPARPVRIVCNFPAGSSPDVLARAISLPLQQALGQPVVVENKAGASGMIGAEQVARSAPDGYTLLMTAGSTITTNPFIFAKMPYDTARDLAAVAPAARLNLFLVTRGDFPAQNVQQFLAYLKARPGKTTYGSAGNATGLHLAGEMLKNQAGVDALHAPYKGASPALQDLLGGQIDFYFDPGIALGHVTAGKLKMMAIAAPKRSSLFPDVPTLDEAGLKGFDAGTTHGFYAPAGTPAAVIERLNREINRIVVMPEVRAQMAQIAAEPTPMSPQQFEAVMRADSQRYGAVIKAANIKAD